MALDEIMSKFGGKWETDRGENIEDFMVEMGFHEAIAKMAAVGRVEENIEVKDEKIRIIVQQNDFYREDIFQLDEPSYFEVNQVKRKALTSYKEGKLEMNIHPIDSDSPPYRIVREISNGEMIEMMCVREVVCKRIFKHL